MNVMFWDHLPWPSNSEERTSLVVQWLRMHLPMQGKWVQSLVPEDAICYTATKPESHNYWSPHMLWSPRSAAREAHIPQLESRPCLPQLEKACMQQWKPSAARNNKFFKIIIYMLLQWHPTAAAAKLLQSCPTLCDPIDGSPPGSPVPGICN